jgi:protein involved in polysaccharide export with SLBB domain
MKAVFVLLLLLAPLVSTTRSQATDRSQQSGTPSDSEDKTICVLGNVSKPSRLRFRTGITVTKAIEEAGGNLPNSKSKKVRVYSQTTEGVIRVLDVDLDIVRKKPYMDLELQSFDIVEVVFSKKDKIPKVVPNPCFSQPLKGIH